MTKIPKKTLLLITFCLILFLNIVTIKVNAVPCPIFGKAEYENGVSADGSKVEIKSEKGVIVSTVGPKGGFESGYWQVDCGEPHNWPVGTNFTLTIKGIGNYSNWSNSTNGTVLIHYTNMGTIILQNQKSNSNLIPVADASAGEPYSGNVGENISFNATNSFDPDGYIISWIWDFGDGSKETGEVINHIYSQKGEYKITLEVSDNNGSIDFYETTAIIEPFNFTQLKPIIEGPSAGNINTNYDFTINSQDNFLKNVSYIVDWDDGTNDTISNFNLTINVTHQWEIAGVYYIKVIASGENNTKSEMTESLIAIDTDILYLAEIIKGYLYDNDRNGVFDSFYDNNTKKNISIDYVDNLYLLDIDDDANYDYQINSDGNVSIYQTKRINKTPGFEILLIILSLITLIIINRKK